MDISAVDSYQNIGGIQQPVIGQRKIEQEIRLKEGEANIMGGILEETETKNLQGIPGLAQIPFFRYLFSSEQKNRIDNELVFMLIPHIVRAQELKASNTQGGGCGYGQRDSTASPEHSAGDDTGDQLCRTQRRGRSPRSAAAGGQRRSLSPRINRRLRRLRGARLSASILRR